MGFKRHHRVVRHKRSSCKLSRNRQCGPKKGHTVCPRGQYCSRWNWCGKTAAYKRGNQKRYSNGFGCSAKRVVRRYKFKRHHVRRHHKRSSCKLSRNRQCGPKKGHTVCPRGQYCSRWNWCGKTAAYKRGNQKRYSNG